MHFAKPAKPSIITMMRYINDEQAGGRQKHNLKSLKYMTGLTVNLSLQGLTAPHIQIQRPADFKDSEIVDTREKLYAVFKSFEKSITQDVGISPEMTLINVVACDDPEEFGYYLMFKNTTQRPGMSIYCFGESLLYVVEIDRQTKFTSIIYGSGGCNAAKFTIGKELGRRQGYRLPVSVLQEEFQKFLETFKPKIAEWDEKDAHKELAKVNEGQKVPPWLAHRIVGNWPIENPTNSEDLILVGETLWNKDLLSELLRENRINMFRVGDEVSLSY